MDPSAALPGWTTPAVAALVFTGLTLAELRRPLRRSVETKLRRIARNLTTGWLAQAVAVPLQLACVAPLALAVEHRGMGLLHVVSLPPWLAACLAVVLLDYTLWHWHWLNHCVPFLWRFHAVHHADLDLDASTALRFHFGEMALATGWRALQVIALGVGPLGLSIYTLVLFASILFHHSNVALPHAFERRLVHLVATPRMHGIHHSIERDERNTNYASILTAWDVLHRTLLLNIPQRDVTIGLPVVNESSSLTLGRMLLFPFRRHALSGDPPSPARERITTTSRGHLEA